MNLVLSFREQTSETCCMSVRTERPLDWFWREAGRWAGAGACVSTRGRALRSGSSSYANMMKVNREAETVEEDGSKVRLQVCRVFLSDPAWKLKIWRCFGVLEVILANERAAVNLDCFQQSKPQLWNFGFLFKITEFWLLCGFHRCPPPQLLILIFSFCDLPDFFGSPPPYLSWLQVSDHESSFNIRQR